MIPFPEDLIIEELVDNYGLSVRAHNNLRRSGVHTVGQMIKLQENDLMSMRNIGTKTKSEILQFIEKIQAGEMVYDNKYPVTESLLPEVEYDVKVMFWDSDGAVRSDIPLEELELSVRSYNALKANGFSHISQFHDMPFYKLINIQNMGQKSAKEVYDLIKSKTVEISLIRSPRQASNEILHLAEQFTSEFSNFFYIQDSNLVSRILPIIFDHYQNHADESQEEGSIYSLEHPLLETIFSHPFFHNLLIEKIKEVFSSRPLGLSYDKLVLNLPNKLLPPAILDPIINEMIECSMITYNHSIFELKLPSIYSYIEELKDDRASFVLKSRFEGNTLEAIAQEFGITRERVRQIELKQINKIKATQLQFQEDRYRLIFQKYDFDKNSFSTIFAEPFSTYHYLAIRYSKGQDALEGILEDETIPVSVKKAAERYIYRSYLKIDGEYIKLDRIALSNYVLRTEFREEGSYEDFVIAYERFLNQHGLSGQDRYTYDYRTFQNRLNDHKNVLWKQFRRLRYYDFEEYDFAELLQILALDQYRDVEYSTLKFFREFPDLMQQYDIRDEYELHNLLKKIYRSLPESETNIDFQRMPMIAFGEASRIKQIEELLLKMVPVSLDQLAEAYEAEYGGRTATLKNDILKHFSIYYHQSMFRMDLPELNPAETEALSEQLVDDFYFLDKIKLTYQRLFPHSNIKNINPYTIKKLGFMVYTDYAIRNTYLSASDYFRFILTHQDIVNLNENSSKITQLITFTSQLYKLKANYEIIEFLPLQFVHIRRLMQRNINEGQFRAYCDAVDRFAYPGEYFTIASLRDRGFEHELDHLGFDEWFYSSILAEDKTRFSLRRVTKSNRIFCKGTCEVYLKDLIRQVVADQNSIDIYELREILIETYNISTDKQNLIKHIKESTMFYDAIMERVYINYEKYFEEV